ncbi:hypothetical protein RJT34_13452 [Clitoria ternatea]|uniref:Uncharacterized protein n=1 Tax=Clitoria ternatea TaxID=43366 RepID=A0AAN9JNL8_CLITE
MVAASLHPNRSNSLLGSSLCTITSMKHRLFFSLSIAVYTASISSSSQAVHETARLISFGPKRCAKDYNHHWIRMSVNPTPWEAPQTKQALTAYTKVVE